LCAWITNGTRPCTVAVDTAAHPQRNIAKKPERLPGWQTEPVGADQREVSRARRNLQSHRRKTGHGVIRHGVSHRWLSAGRREQER
jgi:hypothetical protein